MPHECPSDEQLKAYALGQLREQSIEEISDHLERCNRCETTVGAFDQTADSLIAQLQAPAIPSAVAETPAYQGILPTLVDALGRVDKTLSVQHEQRRVRDYEILEQIGEGGMGAVFLARHTKLKRVVALKVLPQEKVKRASVARFEREMEAVGKLNHSNVVQAHDAGEFEGTHYLVMEYVAGFDLATLVKRVGQLSIPDACEIICQAAQGLQHVHENGLVHRDIKPSNLLLSQEGQIKVLDLGLALLHGNVEEELTSTGQVMGTLDYLAPEQAKDTHEVDIRADIYSLGATLYKLLCKKAPFEDGYSQPLKKLMAITSQPVPSVANRRPELPPELVQTIDRMLAREPDARYPTPAEVLTALRPFAAGADLSQLLESAGELPRHVQASQSTARSHASQADTRPVTPRAILEPPLQRVIAMTSRGWIWGLAVVIFLAVAVGGWFLGGSTIEADQARITILVRAAEGADEPERMAASEEILSLLRRHTDQNEDAQIAAAILDLSMDRVRCLDKLARVEGTEDSPEESPSSVGDSQQRHEALYEVMALLLAVLARSDLTSSDAQLLTRLFETVLQDSESEKLEAEASLQRARVLQLLMVIAQKKSADDKINDLLVALRQQIHKHVQVELVLQGSFATSGTLIYHTRAGLEATIRAILVCRKLENGETAVSAFLTEVESVKAVLSGGGFSVAIWDGLHDQSIFRTVGDLWIQGDHQCRSGAILASATFSDGDEGWTVGGDAYEFTAEPGMIHAKDQSKGEGWFFEAPEKFLGDKSRAYGHLLEFELINFAGPHREFEYSFAGISDGETSLWFYPKSREAHGWTRCRVCFHESHDWFIESSDRRATREDLQRVLSNLKFFRITGEQASGGDHGGLRNVVLFGAPR